MEGPLHLIILILHVLGAAIIIGSAFVSVLILWKEKIPRHNLVLLDNIWKIVGPLVGVQVLTGIYLAAGEWDEFGQSFAFWLKMALLVVEGYSGGVVLNRKIKENLKKKGEFIVWPNASKRMIIALFLYTTMAIIGVFLAETI